MIKRFYGMFLHQIEVNIHHRKFTDPFNQRKYFGVYNMNATKRPLAEVF